MWKRGQDSACLPIGRITLKTEQNERKFGKIEEADKKKKKKNPDNRMWLEVTEKKIPGKNPAIYLFFRERQLSNGLEYYQGLFVI